MPYICRWFTFKDHHDHFQIQEIEKGKRKRDSKNKFISFVELKMKRNERFTKINTRFKDKKYREKTYKNKLQNNKIKRMRSFILFHSFLTPL